MILKIKDISFSYKSPILKNVTFEAQKGITAILGKNGTGKSTLLKTMAKILLPTNGAIYFSGKNLFYLKNKEFVKKISYVSQKQNPNSLNVYEMLLLGRRAYFKFNPTKQDYEIVENVIKKLNLEKIKFTETSKLSGGELQKVAIARAIVQNSDIVLLDEPTNNLDIKNQIEILKLLKSLNKISIIVLHDINLAIKFCDKFIFLKNGEIIYQGDKNIINEKLIKEIYEIDVDICYFKNSPIIIPK